MKSQIEQIAAVEDAVKNKFTKAKHLSTAFELIQDVEGCDRYTVTYLLKETGKVYTKNYIEAYYDKGTDDILLIEK